MKPLERLTYNFTVGGQPCWQVRGADNLTCGEVCKNQEESGCEKCPICEAIDRLAAYEDTGLTPAEIIGLCAMDKRARMAELLRQEEYRPLTLEEMREMDGEPVWVCEPNGTNGVWGLVDLEYQMVRLHGGGLAIWENNDKSWMAYRRKPEEGASC